MVFHCAGSYTIVVEDSQLAPSVYRLCFMPYVVCFMVGCGVKQVLRIPRSGILRGSRVAGFPRPACLKSNWRIQLPSQGGVGGKERNNRILYDFLLSQYQQVCVDVGVVLVRLMEHPPSADVHHLTSSSVGTRRDHSSSPTQCYCLLLQNLARLGTTKIKTTRIACQNCQVDTLNLPILLSLSCPCC